MQTLSAFDRFAVKNIRQEIIYILDTQKPTLQIGGGLRAVTIDIGRIFSYVYDIGDYTTRSEIL